MSRSFRLSGAGRYQAVLDTRVAPEFVRQEGEHPKARAVYQNDVESNNDF